MSFKTITQNKPNKLVASFVKAILEGGRAVKSNYQAAAETNHESTSSFLYDTFGNGIKSTQQINLDWSKFENHTFFNTAVGKVNIAFDRIINGFPFDGTRQEFEAFFETLTGFEKWVYDSFPKNKGFLFFSGSLVGEDHNGTHGTYLTVSDFAGSVFPQLAKNNTGEPILDPGLNSLTFEMQLYVPSQSNDNQIICQKLDTNNQGYSLYLSQSANPTCNLYYAITSGSHSLLASASIVKGQFNHICAIFNRNPGVNRLQVFVNETLVNETPNQYEFGTFSTVGTPFIIGSGSSIVANNTIFLPQQTLSGAIDELRVFHNTRTIENQIRYAKKSVFPDATMKLYYKFNEPTGTIGSSVIDPLNFIVLDSSGNSLHAFITGSAANISLRNTSSLNCPLTYEKLDVSPVLFPYFAPLIALNNALLTSASAFDAVNPNLITKLVPQHYLTEGQNFDGFQTLEGDITNQYSGTSIPGSGKLGHVQLMLTFLYIWAKFFDEMKIYVDSFSNVLFADYDPNDSVPDAFIQFLFQYLGFDAPSLYNDSLIEQFVDAENIDHQFSNNQYSLRYIQNQIMRRILTNFGEITKSKGTIHAVKSLIRSVGIDPDNSMRIKEFGGPTNRTLQESREFRVEPIPVLDFILSGSSAATLSSSFLYSTRIEIGSPQPSGIFTNQNITPPHGNSTVRDDGLLTSGSWTYEAIYRYPRNRPLTAVSQSLARMHVTGTNELLVANLVAVSGSTFNPARIEFYARPNTTASADLFHITLPIDVFDGDKWNISFGRRRNDSFASLVSSSYFLRAAKKNVDSISQQFVTQSYYNELKNATGTPVNLWSRFDSTLNSSGSFIRMGKTVLVATGTALNDTVKVTDSLARATNFDGQVFQMRFWSKFLTGDEWLEHVKNFRSLGVADPLTNFNFLTYRTGAFERLRMDVNMDQDDKLTDANGSLRFFDFSQNGFHCFGSGFVTSSNPFITDVAYSSMLSPYFDEGATSEKVRVRSFLDSDLAASSSYAQVAPIYSLNPSDLPQDDVRFSIEFSIVDALNRDMIKIFSTLETLDNVLGSPELVFSADYPSLSDLREMYFNRLTGNMNLKGFFEFYKWFDTSIGIIIEQLLPRKTKYFGTNFVIESHMLERSKLEYLFSDIYLNENSRRNKQRFEEQYDFSLKKF